ncbi:MAG: hypothetical protein MI757_20520 [Pirellulales bacterium]|nr:hypothetical protein [Pirellulales bacterium]
MFRYFALLSLVTLAILQFGCNEKSAPNADKSPAAKTTPDGYDADALAKRIEKSMGELSTEDRKLAEAQKFCPVGVEFDDTGKPVRGLLGTIGKPVKLMVDDKAVFIMCPSCVEEFEGDTEKYVAVLAKIKAAK